MLRLVLVLVTGAVAVWATNRIIHSTAFRFSRDFLEYWGSARLNLHGENPYDPARLLAEQRSVDPERDRAVMMWNPPPALAVYTPLALFEPRWASIFWMAFQVGSVLLACEMIRRVYAPQQPRGLTFLLCLSFVGTLWLVAYGQNAGFITLGLAGFLYYTRRDRPAAAGAFAALTALKPHLLAGFGVLLLADAVTRRGRIALAVGATIVALALALVMLLNPNVISQFVAAVRDPGPDAIPLNSWKVPLLSFWLRMALAPELFWIQFVPCVIACSALLVWRVRTENRGTGRGRFR